MHAPHVGAGKSASEIVVAQAIPRLIEHLSETAWAVGESPEQYLSFPEAWANKHPALVVLECVPELASPYAVRNHEYVAFTSREAPNNGPYHANAHRLQIDGFSKEGKGSWMHYYPTKEPGSKVMTGRTYVSLPADLSALDVLEQVGNTAADSFARSGTEFKVSNNLREVHSIVIYDDGSAMAQDGLERFVTLLRDREIRLADTTVLTALPIIPGVARSPEVPEKMQAYYRDKTGDDGISWSQFIGLCLRVSAQFGLRDHSITDVQAQKQELIDHAALNAGSQFSSILSPLGIDPMSYTQR